LALCLEGLGRTWGVAGRPAVAAQLLGAAAALREAQGSPLHPAERAAYDRDLAAARAQIDEPTWAAAWAQGRALDGVAASAYARAVVAGTQEPGDA
ncbi:MAG TPA: hypothetical protein VKY74_03035, partial [Chloroflexia bacterium]|nr:hypothetical protein [Chloroflexia bacterium]